ncbi:MAG: hypothetical protein JSW35_03550 [Deltaproteobacteria bacterium]|nr:MAG: hypothetical protein JSW35_03550 [Deltaproteobacteria bacterium]
MATIGDVVLVYYREEPAFFARIDSIEPDTKKHWFRVQLLILTIPPRTVTWILREEYIDGVPFTMEGHAARIEAVNPLPIASDSEDTKREAMKRAPSKDGKKIIPFRKPRREDIKGA